MLPFIVLTLFLSPVVGVETEEEKIELSVLLRRISDLEKNLKLPLFRRISDLEERLHVQERINKEQDTVIKILLLEKTDRTSALKTTTIETEGNDDAQWQNGDLENKTVSGEGVREVATGINPQTLPSFTNIFNYSKKISPELVSKKIRRANIADVAFYSYLSHNEKDPGHHQTIIFDNAVTNVGGNYNHHTGIFTAPQNGVFTFSWTFYCNSGGFFVTELVVNSNPVGASDCNAQGADYIRHTTGVVVVEISQGDVVYVRTHPTVTIAGYIFSSLEARTSFSGWKLF